VASDGSAFGDSIIRKAIRHTAMMVQPIRGKRRKRLWRFHHTDADPPYRDPKQQNAPHEGEAFSLQRRIQ